MAIKTVDFPIKNGDFPVRKLLVYQRVIKLSIGEWEIHRWKSMTFPSILSKTPLKNRSNQQNFLGHSIKKSIHHGYSKQSIHHEHPRFWGETPSSLTCGSKPLLSSVVSNFTSSRAAEIAAAGAAWPAKFVGAWKHQNVESKRQQKSGFNQQKLEMSWWAAS